MRICHCVGYLTNPGGVCCRDLRTGDIVRTTTTGPWIPQVPMPVPQKSWPKKQPNLPQALDWNKIKRIEYYPDGTVKSVEYWEDSDLLT